MLTFQEFAQLEIKIGMVVHAERIPGADRLLIVIVDFGQEQRQIVAGFGHRYTPEDPIGKQAPCVLNIEPAMIRGVESHGIFIAIDADEPVLLLPERPVENGSKVK